MLLLGHRGARRYAPENTLAAFDLALEHGADGFEFDVRRTRNRQPIICHDPRLNRLSVRQHTLKQLQASFASEERMPPCLDDVLRRYTRTAFLNIEIKVRGIGPLIVSALKHIPPRHGYFISSFYPGVLRELHVLNDSLILGTLAHTHWQLRRWSKLPVHYVVPNYKLLSRKLVEEVHAADKLVVTWTVNEKRKMLRAAELGVDGIISDDTQLLRKTFN
ncbi:MAG TPA: glycerophosphodiester phosphodiesterase [Candidatus Solibacter sp.]|jgi:glycerophosphoryl diester phosphodiesterase|nr:glycerophosphodiester phosphodiesterase [Candidatus Solibacter sp.]